MIDQSFLDTLEYAISRALNKSPIKEHRKYCCDGIIVDDFQETFDHAVSNGYFIARAIMPKGQYEDDNYNFNLIVYFGKNAKQKLNTSGALHDCIPGSVDSEWINLDVKAKEVRIHLL